LSLITAHLGPGTIYSLAASPLSLGLRRANCKYQRRDVAEPCLLKRLLGALKDYKKGPEVRGGG
jgi:hypothetical protein